MDSSDDEVLQQGDLEQLLSELAQEGHELLTEVAQKEEELHEVENCLEELNDGSSSMEPTSRLLAVQRRHDTICGKVDAAESAMSRLEDRAFLQNAALVELTAHTEQVRQERREDEELSLEVRELEALCARTEASVMQEQEVLLSPRSTRLAEMSPRSPRQEQQTLPSPRHGRLSGELSPRQKTPRTPRTPRLGQNASQLSPRTRSASNYNLQPSRSPVAVEIAQMDEDIFAMRAELDAKETAMAEKAHRNHEIDQESEQMSRWVLHEQAVLRGVEHRLLVERDETAQARDAAAELALRTEARREAIQIRDERVRAERANSNGSRLHMDVGRHRASWQSLQAQLVTSLLTDVTDVQPSWFQGRAPEVVHEQLQAELLAASVGRDSKQMELELVENELRWHQYELDNTTRSLRQFSNGRDRWRSFLRS
mmetsp:Transcript_36575/g.97502  ORF Transcript_36575/g.97502 Transcript_36575/m.97502 type:complete len:427 (-) Transcript_36575:175-1455(-)